MKVKELKKAIADLDDETELTIEETRGFIIKPVVEVRDDSDE